MHIDQLKIQKSKIIKTQIKLNKLLELRSLPPMCFLMLSSMHSKAQGNSCDCYHKSSKHNLKKSCAACSIATSILASFKTKSPQVKRIQITELI